MKFLKKHAKTISYKTLSFFVALSVFVGLFATFIGVMLTSATNPGHVNALNRSSLVQMIDLKPVVLGEVYYNDSTASGAYKKANSRTDFLKSTDSNVTESNCESYIDIVKDNETENVRIETKKEIGGATSSTKSSVSITTKIGQKINLKENPYLMFSFTGNCSYNGFLCITVYHDQTRTLINPNTTNQGYFLIADWDTALSPKANTDILEPVEYTAADGSKFYSGFSIYDIYNGTVKTGQSSYNGENNFFTNYNAVDFSVDFYKFLYKYYEQMNCLNYWPDWDNGDYITIEYINHTLAGDENVKPLYNGEYVDFSVAALGRSALNPQSSLTPRVPGEILKGENGAREGGRAQRIDDGSFVFLNPSENEDAVFKWYINRYVNVNELESLVFDADLEFGENATKQDITMKMALLGANITTKDNGGYKSSYTQKGFYAYMDQMIQKYSNCENINDIVKKYQNVTIDFHTVCKGYVQKTGVDDAGYPAGFMPEDNLVHVRDIILTLPPKSKLTINNFTFNVENVYASASTPDTVYPWVSTESANAIPTYGTPVGSQHIDAGSYAKTQNWVVSDDYEAPDVYKKSSVIDLKKGSGTMTGFWRTLDGSTYMTCNTTSDSDYKTQTLSNGSVSINLSETPYLYYSYELDGDDAAVAFHFDFGSSGSYSDCFLSGSGLSLDNCSGMMGSNYFKSYPNYVYKSMSSSASARTGVIDLAKLKSDYYNGSFMSGTVSLKSLNVYMTGKNAKLRVRYMFFGTKTIDVSKITEPDIIAVKAGDHFPWAVSPTTFDEVTLGGNSSDRCVYANRLDMLDDMIDRATWAYRSIVGNRSAKVGTPEIGSIVDEDDYYDKTNNKVIQNPQTPTFKYTQPDNGGDGSITVSAYQTEEFKFVGQFYNREYYGGYDHFITFDVPSTQDLTSMRYLNYSVNAEPGMRWSIMINLQKGRETTSKINKTLVFSWNGTAVEIKQTTECPGVKSYFDSNSCYAIPGSGTGCIDLWNYLYKGDVNAISSIRLLVYKDKNEMKDVNGENYADISVTFNYLHLTSEALKPSSWGTMPMDPQNTDSVRNPNYVGKSYSWPRDNNTSIKTPTGNSDERTFTYPVYNADWSTDYYLNSSKTKFDFSTGPNYKTHYSLYYSYYLTKIVNGTDTGEMAYAPITMTIWQEQYTTYSYRSRKTDIGEAIVTPSASFDEDLKGCLRLQMPECGQILLDDLGIEGITFIRFHYDGAKYQLHVQELTIRVKSGQKTYSGNTADYSNTPYQSENSGTSNKVLAKLNSGLSVDFASKYPDTRTINTTDSDYNDRIKIISGINSNGDITPYYETNTKFINSKNKDNVVDLNKTPYLYYSLKCNNNATGTFALHFNVGNDNTNAKHYFFRNGAVSIQTETSGYYLSLDQTPAVSQYLPTSENGCLDIRAWLLDKKLITSTNATITVKGVGFYVNGDGVNDSVLFNYMYFDGLSEKTVDLLPAKSHGMLENASNTRTWLFTSGNSSELSRDWDEDAQWDAHDKNSQFQDDDNNNQLERDNSNELITDVRHLPDGGAPDDDNLPDGYNDFRVRSNPDKVAAGEGNRWSWISVNYGALTGSSSYKSGVKDDKGNALDYHYVTSGNNQMSGLFVDLNDTPYLHFSISQSEDSYSTFLLQANKYTPNNELNGLSFVENLKPWLSNYNTKSAAGQLVHVPPQTYNIRSYKDYMQEDYNGTYQNGDYAGVIDLRSWFTETNGYGNIISLERIRFYTAGNLGTCSDFTVNHFYLSSSPASSYTVTFDNNIPEDPATSETEHLTRTVHVLKNANEQYVSDSVVESYKTRKGYTFVGWYTDEDWENYYDISEKPVSENLTLYAGWIKDDDVVKGEVDLLRPTIENPSSVVETGGLTQQGEKAAFWHVEEDSLHITNNGVTDYTVSIPVNLPYSLLASRSLYIGFDTSTSMNTAFGDPSNGNAAKIEYVLKSLGTHRYDVLGEAFGEYYTGNTNGILSAGPYDKQLPIYSYLSENNLRPDLIKENQEHGYVVAKSIDFTVPAGCSIHVRYATAAKAMDSTSLEVVAPEITSSERVSGTSHQYSTGIIDLLDPREDMGYIEQLKKVTYTCPESMTSIYNREDSTPSELHQATLNSASMGYVSLGGQYGLGDYLGYIDIQHDDPATKDDDVYLYFAVDQSETSKTSFAIYADIYYKDVNKDVEKGSWSPRWLSFYDAASGGILSSKELVDGSLPHSSFLSGSASGYINLTEWYRDSLNEESGAETGDYLLYVRIRGIRLYSFPCGTDAVYKYLAIGGKDASDGSDYTPPVASYKDQEGTDKSFEISKTRYGQTVQLTLDQLTDCTDAHDPSKQFLGWSFDNQNIVYWNPDAENARMYSDDNTTGAWSTQPIQGFSQNCRDIAYQLTDDTNIIYPMFGDPVSCDLNLNVNGGTVKMYTDNDDADRTITSNQTISGLSYGSTVVLSVPKNVPGFLGWYDGNGKFLSSSSEYVCLMYGDVIVTAKFGSGAAQPNVVHDISDASDIVWLQTYGTDSLVAGKDFYLQALQNDTFVYDKEHGGKLYVSDIAAIGDSPTEIACYWSLKDGQYVKAVAPSNYHWEMYLQDGTTVSLGTSNTYSFIVSTDIKLICTPNDASSSTTADVIVNEYAVDYDRTENDHTAVVTAQALLDVNEELVFCGAVIAKRPDVVQFPGVDSNETLVYKAEAWNSTTGQYTISIDFTKGYAQYLRAFVVVRDVVTGAYTLHYSDYLTLSF